jgi:hypothetical protein
MNVIIYPQGDHIAIVTPAGTKTAEELVAKVVPAGKEYKIVDSASIPDYPGFFKALTFSDPVTIDMDKAKELTHVIRRAARATEFAPYDDIIAKQIPGADATAAEAARAEIRAKYETIQNNVDACTTPEALQTIIAELNG